MKKHSVIILAAIALIALILWFGNATDTQYAAPPPDVNVRVGTVQRQPLRDSFAALGTAQARESLEVTARRTGMVGTIHFRDNQAVAEGELLVELEAASERAALAEARVALAEDRRVLDHYQTLIKTAAVSKTLLEEQRAKVATSEARVAAAEAALADLTIRAPFAGVLGFRQVSPGTLVEPGTVITTLDAVATIEVAFSAPEYWVGKIAEGNTLTAKSIAYPGREFSATVLAVGTRVDPATRAVAVLAAMDNKEQLIKPGMLLNIQLTGQPREVLVVSEEALLQEGPERFVYLVAAGDQVERRPVETGVRSQGWIEIVAGLAEGDLVVTEGVQKVRPGTAVTILAGDREQ